MSILVILILYPSPTYQVSPSLRLLSSWIVIIDAEARDRNSENVIDRVRINASFFMS